MSADNYYIIRKDVNGFYVPVMGFVSSEEEGYVPRIDSRDVRFTTVSKALNYACEQYTEYGVQVHPECESEDIPELEKTHEGHYFDCPVSDKYWDDFNDFPAVCDCEDVFKDWSYKVEPSS